LLVYACLLLLASNPAQSKPLLQQGLIALQRGDLAEARKDLEQAAKADPRNGYVWSSLAETYLRLHDRNQAMSAASTAEKLGDKNPVIAHALAIFYLNAGDTADGLKFAQLVADPQISFQYADALLHQENFAQAADLLTTALAKHPDDAQLTIALGVARYGQRRFDEAITLFLKTIQLAPDAEQPYVFLGKMLDQAGPHLPEITADFEQWAVANPSSGLAQLLLAKALLTSDPHSERALELLHKSVARDAKSWEAHYQLGVLLENKHDYPAAAAELAASAQLDPKQPMPHYHLARVYDRLGEADRAKTEREIHQRLTNPPLTDSGAH
jgi:Flp pilus assembly protein TadD